MDAERRAVISMDAYTERSQYDIAADARYGAKCSTINVTHEFSTFLLLSQTGICSILVLSF